MRTSDRRQNAVRMKILAAFCYVTCLTGKNGVNRKKNKATGIPVALSTVWITSFEVVQCYPICITFSVSSSLALGICTCKIPFLKRALMSPSPTLGKYSCLSMEVNERSL